MRQASCFDLVAVEAHPEVEDGESEGQKDELVGPHQMQITIFVKYVKNLQVSFKICLYLCLYMPLYLSIAILVTLCHLPR